MSEHAHEQILAPTMQEMMAQMARMQAELDSLKARSHQRATTLPQFEEPSTSPQPAKITSTRRKTLKRLGLALLSGAVAATATDLSAADAKIVANPGTSKVGAIVLSPKALPPTGSANTSYQYGLIGLARSDTTTAFSLTNDLPEGDIGIFGNGFYGLYGKGTFGVIANGTYGGIYSEGPNYGVYGSGTDKGVYGSSTTNGVYGSATNTGVYGESTRTEVYPVSFGVVGKSIKFGVYGVGGNVTTSIDESYPSTGVFGNSTGTGVYGLGDNVGVYGTGKYGVYGIGTGSTTNYGIFGQGVDYGVHGTGRIAIDGVSTGNNGIGVHGGAAPGTNVKAGVFDGTVNVNGLLTATTKQFKIDHPLDPENKYLYHTSVESPDMKNLYDGVVTLDGQGEAVVEMPEWFEALNFDFRYQLTCLGEYSPVFVAEKMTDRRFKIAGGKSGQEISWQVTGIRQDAFAKANRSPVEEDKSGEEMGLYIHPEAFGKPKEISVSSLYAPK